MSDQVKTIILVIVAIIVMSFSGVGIIIVADNRRAIMYSEYNVKIRTPYIDELAYSYEKVENGCIKIMPGERLICGSYEIIPIKVKGNEGY